eukprot:5864636-Lingulodinium_polyedra.AAC.1
MVVGGIRQPGVSDTPRCIPQHVTDPHCLLPALHDRQPPPSTSIGWGAEDQGQEIGPTEYGSGGRITGT